MMFMYQRIVFGELSDFLKGLGHHLTDMTRVELLTLTPLVALTLIFGVAPGILLRLIELPVAEVLAQFGVPPAVGTAP
jgi:NADH:ubiquinone oxidoreductase subunit 4 (subunit M)